MALGGRWLTDGTGDNVLVSERGNDQLKPNGFTGGIQAGYNYQIRQWVLGIEADANYFGMKKDFFSGPFTNTSPASGDSYTVTSSFESNWYLYVDPGSVSFATSGVCAPGAPGFANCPLYTAAHSAHLKANIVRAGINYRFN